MCFAHSNLDRAHLTGAKLGGATLSDALLRGTDLSGADLRGADLTRADLDGAILLGADLEGLPFREDTYIMPFPPFSCQFRVHDSEGVRYPSPF